MSNLHCTRCNAEMELDNYGSVELTPHTSSHSNTYLANLCPQCFAQLADWIVFGFTEDPVEF